MKDVLHSLPVTQKAQFKVCTLVCMATHRRTNLHIWFDGKVNGNLLTFWQSSFASDSSFTSLTVRRMCYNGGRSYVIKFASWCSLQCLIANNMGEQRIFFYHGVWKWWLVMVLTSAWTLIVKLTLQINFSIVCYKNSHFIFSTSHLYLPRSCDWLAQVTWRLVF